MVWTLFLFLKSTDLSILHTSGKLPVFESLVSETGFAQYRASPDVQSERPNEVEYYLVEHPDLSTLLMPEDVRVLYRPFTSRKPDAYLWCSLSETSGGQQSTTCIYHAGLDGLPTQDYAGACRRANPRYGSLTHKL